jgi:hypothetical protein
MRGVRRHGYRPGIDAFLKAALPTRILKRHGQSLHRRAPGSSLYDTGAGSHTVIPGLQRREVGGCFFLFFSSSSCCFGDLEFCE